MAGRYDDIKERFNGFPRALQWAIYAAVVIGLFLIWDSVVQRQAGHLRERADLLQMKADKVRFSRELSGQLRNRSVADLVRAYGPVTVPESAAESTKAMGETVKDVLASYRLKNSSYSQSPGGRLPKTALTGIARGKRISRLSGEVNFESKAEDATAIIAALEGSPDVEMITKVTISKANPGYVKVRLSLESWVLGGGS
jgi:osmotically-inducible protein OsmY